MDGSELFDKLLDLRGLNPNALADAIRMPQAQSGFDRFRKGQIKQPKLDTRMELAAKRLGVSVLAFYDGALADQEWQRVSRGDPQATGAIAAKEPDLARTYVDTPSPKNASPLGKAIDTLVRVIATLTPAGREQLAKDFALLILAPDSAGAKDRVHAALVGTRRVAALAETTDFAGNPPADANETPVGAPSSHKYE